MDFVLSTLRKIVSDLSKQIICLGIRTFVNFRYLYETLKLHLVQLTSPVFFSKVAHALLPPSNGVGPSELKVATVPITSDQ